MQRLSFPDLNEEKSTATGKKLAWLTLSAEGIVLTLPDENEVWLLDADTLAKKGATSVTNPQRVVSVPRLPIAFAVDANDHLSVIDLRGQKVVKEYDPKDFANREVRFERCAVSPDGRHLFTAAAFGELVRMKAEGTELKPEATSLRIGFDIWTVRAEQILPHPDGGRLLLLGQHKGDTRVWSVEVARE